MADSSAICEGDRINFFDCSRQKLQNGYNFSLKSYKAREELTSAASFPDI